ncbi:MAG: L,D-transpeptidase family protein [Vicinamibacteraceae bacterium]
MSTNLLAVLVLNTAGIRRILPRLLLALLAVLSAVRGSGIASQAIDLPWNDARQLVLVTTADWDADHGVMRTFIRTKSGWRPAAAAVPVTIGRSGSAWGLGLHPKRPGPVKREGDGRSPAGVFRIGVAFGYAKSARTALPYVPMRASHYCIDVSVSPLYNRIVDAREVGEPAVAGSTEPMRRDLHADGDQVYEVGFVIEHNRDAQAGAGSCIFAHLWRTAGAPTVGCTAMAEPAIRDLLTWLRPEAHAIFVLLPEGEYTRVRAEWQLPDSAVRSR